MAEEKQQIQIKIEPDMEAGIFANAVSVHVNQNEVVIDFGYILPNSKPTTIKVVNRVNLTHTTAESFMRVISNAMLDWRNRQKEQAKKE
jgi:hypothetical protein